MRRCVYVVWTADRVNAGGVVEPVRVEFFDVDGGRSVEERLSADVGLERLVETSREDHWACRLEALDEQ